MIDVSIRSAANIPNLHELQDYVRCIGGAIVRYDRMYSVIAFMHSYPVFVWVPPGSSRVWASLPHVGFTAAFGWWSVFGWFVTPYIIILNLAGGEEVTRRVMQMKSSPRLQDAEIEVAGFRLSGSETAESANFDELDTLATEEQIREERRRGWIAGGLLGIMFVASMIFFACYQLGVGQ